FGLGSGDAPPFWEASPWTNTPHPLSTLVRERLARPAAVSRAQKVYAPYSSGYTTPGRAHGEVTVKQPNSCATPLSSTGHSLVGTGWTPGRSPPPRSR